MSTLRNPVGPQPPSVYWRRRLLVLLGLLAVVAIIVLIIVRPGAGEEGSPSPSDTPTSPPPSSPPPAGGEGTCDPAVIEIVPKVDAAAYPAGQQPQISMEITNRGAQPCSFDVGPAAQEYIIMSGSDLIWNSKDCLAGDSLEMVLEPGVGMSTTPFPWDRTRSSPETCDTTRPEVIAGGATYRLSVKLGDIESESDVPFLLH